MKNDLAAVLARIEEKLRDTGLSADRVSRSAGKPDAIRNLRRAVQQGGRRGVSTATVQAIAPVLGVSAAWILTGVDDGSHIESDAILRGGDDDATVPVVGYVGAGAETQFYPAGELDRVPAPAGSGKRTAALEIRGKSIGTMFDRWIAYFDDVRSPVTDDMIGRLCVVGLADGRTLVKKLARKNGGVVLVSEDGSQIDGGGIEWAALVKSLSPR